MIRVTFLGTAAARPTVSRNVSALYVQREGDGMLFDCGEGTQRQMMRYRTGFGLDAVFFTHMHADHFLGIIGLLRTLGLQGRTDPLDLFGPPGSMGILDAAIHLGVERLLFPVKISELEAGDRVTRDEYDVVAFQVWHGTSAVGYTLVEHRRRGRFDVEKARELGIPEGPLYGRIHRGEAVEWGGRWIQPSEVVGPDRPGRTVAYTGDTGPSDTTVEAAQGAALLVHDGTFGEEERERAHATFHSTARDAGEIAARAGVRRLALTHLSARYSDDPGPLEREARELFAGAMVAHDGLTVEIPYDDPPSDSES